MGKHHKPSNPVKITRRRGRTPSGKILVFGVERSGSVAWPTLMEEKITIPYGWADDVDASGKHRPIKGSYRIVELDCSDKAWLTRGWILRKDDYFSKKLFMIDSDGRYIADWGPEDTNEYRQRYGKFPPLRKMLRLDELIDYYLEDECEYSEV